ncbi:MAG: hypothetical protein ABI549_08955 [Flavobacterium sp.]|uniref:hypothetical protein n=1 Tax=Flavobacterium sp. TaxID=239 RepID=UPI003267411B
MKTDFPEDKQVAYSEYIINEEKDTILEGNSTVYNYDGIKISSGTYKKGEIVGKTTFYYDNGNIKSINNRDNNQLDIDIVYYYRNGKVERYSMFDELENLAFFIKFDEQGNPKNYKGNCVIERYQYKIKYAEEFKTKINQHLKVGDTLKYKYIVANIPYTKRSFKIENLSVDNSKVKRIIKKRQPIYIDVQEVLTKKGINRIRATAQYEFNDTKETVIKYTTFFDVNVY